MIRLPCRRLLSSLTHVDSQGNAAMVDVRNKPETNRKAIAVSSITVNKAAFESIQNDTNKKGSVLTVAKIAGIQAAKQTSSLIPLCHQINLSHLEISFSSDSQTRTISVQCEARCTGQTGVEMEALVGASLATLTVYDMCKALDSTAVIRDTRLLSKSGGTSK